MAATEKSFLGLAKQLVKATPITADASFKYLLFNQASLAASTLATPLDPEVGGGAMIRDMLKVGVMSGGAVDFVPRPDTLGMFLMGVTGKCTSKRTGFIQVMASHSADGSTVNSGLTNPPSAKKIVVTSVDGAAGAVTVNGAGGPETLTLVGKPGGITTLTFKTITQVEMPRGSGTMKVQRFTTPFTDLLAAQTLTTIPQRFTTISTPAAPDQLRVVTTGAAAGAVIITGTNAGDAVITETIYAYAAEHLTSTASFTTVTSVVLPTSAGKNIIVYYDNVTYTSNFELDYFDQFAAPYYTARLAPGAMWGEQFQDMRVNALGLDFRGASFVRASVGLSGGLPAKVATTTWAAPTYLDSGPQFLSPVCDFELPTSTDIKVLGGSFTAGSAIPLDEQWIVGSYSPDDFDIVSRAFAVTFNIKIADATLYSKMMYDPAGGNAWAAAMFREAAFKMDFLSDKMADPLVPYKMSISGNGQTGDNANVIWSAQPIGLRAGRNVIMSVSGIFLADPSTSANPISISLISKTASY